MEDRTEQLIEEVKIRPALYDKTLKDHTNPCVRRQLWDEVCAAVVENWKELSGEEKMRTYVEVQKKWINLRTCFTRDLKAQKEGYETKNGQKRRKYIHYDNLLFLRDHTEPKRSSERDSSSFALKCQQIKSVRSQTMQTEPLETNLINKKRSKKRRKEDTQAYENSFLKILKQSSTVDTDEDLNFALSLVPVLRSLNGPDKMEAKIRIMSLLKSIKYSSSTVTIGFAPNAGVGSSNSYGDEPAVFYEQVPTTDHSLPEPMDIVKKEDGNVLQLES